MAFSLRKMFSNISYFSKSGEQGSPGEYHQSDDMSNSQYSSMVASESIDFPAIEPDSTSKYCSASLMLPDSVKKFTIKKGSLSDTDLLSINSASTKKKHKNKHLKLDIKKASQSMSDNLPHTDTVYIENTPKHILLDCKSADLFSEKFKKLNFSHSFEFDIETDSETSDEIDIESLSEGSDSESRKEEEKSEIKMCRKVESNCETQLVPSATPESFGDVELDRNEEERISLLLNYQMKFEKVECVLKNLLSEFEFHIEVSKIFNGRSIVTALPGTDVSNIPPMLGKVTYMDNVSRDSPMESWNIIMEKEDDSTKSKFRKQLQSIKHCLENFTSKHLQKQENNNSKNRKIKRSITFDLHKGKRIHKNLKLSNKKRIKHFDFPDFRDAFINLFKCETEDEPDTLLDNSDNGIFQKCECKCHHQSLNQSDSGLTNKTTDNLSNQSITSSIGNFTLDSTTLSAFSESLDQIISYNSFQDTSIFNTMLQRPAIERITFYVQVHSVQLKCEIIDHYESKNSITFFCPACDMTLSDENSLLEHILSQKHCEKIHFLYKTAYIKKCVSSGKEIQPSTVLNPMTMYRDDNKIVCFGDAMYACSLCFENLIVGESILMQHCSDPVHIDHKKKLFEIYE